MNNIKNVIFDLDDTLIHTHRHYVTVRESAFAYMRRVGGLTVTNEEAETHLNEIEKANIRLFGFAKERFPLSLAALYKRLCDIQRVRFDHQIRHKVEGIGWTVYETPHPVVDFATEILETLNLEGYHLYLFTKGDIEIQNLKVNKADLRKYFMKVDICADKTPAAYRALLEKYELDPAESLMVGDSIKSDVNPSLAVGMKAVRIPPKDGAWILEVEPMDSRAMVLDSINDLPSLLRGSKAAAA